jgi:hypothetical protein
MWVMRWGDVAFELSFVVQDSRKLRPASFAMAISHDEQSLSAIAANSAVASRAWVHEGLGRTDVQVSCVCPLVR